MKVVHVCLSNFFIDNYSYQENMLPKFHKKAGYDVEVIASLFTFDEHGKTAYLAKGGSYLNEYGIPVTRLEYAAPTKLYKKLRRYVGLEEALEKAAPDVLFIHCCQFLDISVVVKYLKKHPDVKVFVDNHADRFNSGKNALSMNILHKIIWKSCAHRILPYTSRFYGVLPARVDFLREVYKLPADKCELLVMGADDDVVEKQRTPEIREEMRKKYGIGDGDVFVVTGGKIDGNKKEIIDLMRAVNMSGRQNLKLGIFGAVVPSLQAAFDEQLSDRVQYTGWKSPEEIYRDFAAADIVAFPGLHSVLWENAVAFGKPCIFRYIPGFTHVDLGGNCLFFEGNTPEAYLNAVSKALDNLDSMEKAALEKGMKVFSYREIAKRALEG